MKETDTKVTVYIDKDIYKQFKIYAVIMNKSISELVEEFMKEIVEKTNAK